MGNCGSITKAVSQIKRGGAGAANPRQKGQRTMKIIYYDGSVLTGNTIEFYDNGVIVDGIYLVELLEIARIESE